MDLVSKGKKQYAMIKQNEMTVQTMKTEMRRDDNKVGVSLDGVYQMAMNMKLRVELWHIIINTINIIMDDSSPLAMQFREFDTDGDNKLNPDEVYELLKLLGKNIYKGSVSSAAKMLNYADEDPQNSLFTFAQFKQFFESLENPVKHDIWKGKYKVLAVIKQVRDAINKKQETATAPGAKPTASDSPFRGDIEITVGPVNQVYNSFIHALVEKTPKAESKPFIKIVFEQSSNQKAKQLEEKFKKLQTSLFDLMKSNDPESAQILDYIHIITNVSDTKLNIFVTTSNQALIELGTIVADFVDQVLANKLEAKVEFKHEFQVDINKFIDKTSDYSFYHALTKNYHTKLVWNAINFKETTKQIFKALDLFKDLKYDKMEPFSLLLIGLLHTELCEANFVFDNVELAATELESKGEILVQLGQLYAKVKEENENLGVIEAIASFDNKFYIEASIGDWKVQVNIQIKDVKQLFSDKIAPEDKQPQNQLQQDQPIEQILIKNSSAVNSLSHKSSSSAKQKVELSSSQQLKKSLKKSGSSSSLKKPIPKAKSPKVKKEQSANSYSNSGSDSD